MLIFVLKCAKIDKKRIKRTKTRSKGDFYDRKGTFFGGFERKPAG